jgi:hypothetical protein
MIRSDYKMTSNITSNARIYNTIFCAGMIQVLGMYIKIKLNK